MFESRYHNAVTYSDQDENRGATGQLRSDGTATVISHVRIIRRQRKAAVTRHLNTISRLIADNDLDSVKDRLVTLRKAFDSLEEGHAEYLDLLSDDTDIDAAEVWYNEVVTDYVEQVSKVNQWLKLQSAAVTPSSDFKNVAAPLHDSSGSAEPGSLSQAQLVNLINLPKVQIDVFSGNALDYQNFMVLFDDNVDKKLDDDSLKLSRLLQYTSGQAKESIKNCVLLGDAGYKTARDILYRRFGSPHLVSRKIIKDLKQGKQASNGIEIQQLSDNLRMAHAALEEMNMLHEIDNQYTIKEILERCPQWIRRKWVKKALAVMEVSDDYPSFGDFASFMAKIAKDMNDPVYGSEGNKTSKAWNANALFASSETGHERIISCVACKQNHALFTCEKFRAMAPEARLKMVKENRLCFNCLKAGHPVKNCRKPGRCTVPNCQRKHSKFIHITDSEKSNSDNKDMAQKGSNSNASSASVSAIGSQIYLPIVPVKVNGALVYALLDNGSNQSFISEKVALDLKLRGRDQRYTVNTVSGTKGNVTKNVAFDLASVDNTFTCHISDVLVIPRIPANYPSSEIDVSRFSHLNDLPLPNIPCGANVDLLLGMDNFHLLTPLSTRRNPNSPRDPYAIESVFGWTLNGYIDRKSWNEIDSNVIQCEGWPTEINLWDYENHDMDCEELGMSIEDQYVLDLWEKEIRLIDGHYYLPIPFRDDIFPNNRYSCMGRLQSLMKRLERTHMTHVYDENLFKFIDKGYMEQVPDNLLDRNDGKVFYLPHHPVVSDKKPGKVRPVFDASASFRGVSLNGQVMCGPDLLNRLLSVLLRFRQYKFAVSADIEAMYLQCRVFPEERDRLRILYYVDGKITDLRLCSHMFGGSWSGSVASFCLQRTVVDNEVSPIVHDTVMRSFYVDDMLRSVKTTEEIREVVSGTKKVLRHGGMNLRDFMTNNKQVLDEIDPEDRAKCLQQVMPESISSKALGTLWNVSEDEFYYEARLSKPNVLTRRTMLSYVSSIYDAIGLISPIVLTAKLCFQDATRLKLTWDEPVPRHLQDRWQIWLDSLDSLPELRFARCVIPEGFEDDCLYELHIFSDSSSQMYGACAYIRAVSSKGKIHIALLTSKGRLAPLKTMSIPRLELTAAVVAVRLHQVLLRDLDLKFDSTYFWSDSQIVLAYIKSDVSRRFKVFVANRVAFIRKFTRPFQWFYIRSKDNPADIISRGCMADKPPKLWRNCPEFLRKFKCDWPSEYVAESLSPIDLSHDNEVVKCTYVNACEADDSAAAGPIDVLADHYSSFYRLKKAVGWLMRLIDFLSDKTSVSKGSITVPEMNKAERVILMHVQKQSFSEELDRLSSGSPVKVSSSLRKLSPVIENELLVVAGRLRHAPMSHRSRNPIILPYKHRISYLIASDFHGNAHLGTDWVLSYLRCRYWIIKARSLIKQVKNKCTVCKRLYGEPMSQQMAPLPPERLIAGEPCFSHCGLDIFGPFYVKIGRSSVKRYGCIFSCFSSRAVHLECLTDLSSDAFINGLIRFSSRRGNVKCIWSDNGTNLVGAKNELKRSFRQLDRDAVVRAARRRDIEWVFNPPFASHHGGCFERLIRTARKVLCAVLTPNARLTDDILQTALCEVENIMNSRPLVPASSDIDDCDPITPNHLLLLRGNYSLPWSVNNEGNVYRRQWRLAQHIAGQFWKRWLREYIPELNRRQKWFNPKPNLGVGDMVLIVDSSVPRGSWPMAKVKEIKVGRDGLVRSARLLTKTSELVRPITKLVFLEGAHYDS